MKKNEIIELVINSIKESTEKHTVLKIDCNYLGGVDVAFSDEKENIEVYRIIIIPHNKPHFE